ncbi:besA [Symbiodinium sp. CCMP2592]|nr:besA [Symbiodinium sp. CCMP2592]
MFHLLVEDSERGAVLRIMQGRTTGAARVDGDVCRYSTRYTSDFRAVARKPTMSELADSLEGELDSSRSPVTDEAVMSIIEQISVLTPEQKEKVRRAILFGSSANLFKDVDRSAFFMNRPSSIPRWRSASPKERTAGTGASPMLGTQDGGYNRYLSSPDCSPRSGSRVLKRTISGTGHPIDDLLRERGHVNRYLVVVSSLSLDWKELIKIPGVSNYELRLLWHLYFLRSQAMRIVMCTSQYIPEALISYYLRYLPSDVSPKEARSRLTTIACNDMTAASVTNKLLSRKRALNRIRDAIEPEKAAMTCFNSTDSEVQLAEELGIPLFGTDTQGAFWGTKTGNRQVFRDAGVQHPDGSYDLIYTEEELCEEILSLLRRCPSTKKVMVKLNDSFSGEGNAVLRVDSELVDSLKESDEQAMEVIFDRLENSLEYVAPGLTWDKYYQQFQTLGGICELFIEGQSSAKTSPSCQAFLNADGSVRILATHEQMLNGQIYTGCTFPAKEEYSAELVSLTKKIGQELVGRQVVGYIAVDFVSVKQSDGSYKHWAIEVNVRMGGTTLPIMTLNFLCRDGRLNEQTSEFIASDGKPRYYVASDTLRKKTYKGLVIEDLLAIIERHSSEIEWNKRPGAPETGTIFHLVTLLSELGKCGCVCIGRSREEAQQIFRRVQDILDAETRTVEVPPTEKAVAAELDLVIEELEGDDEDDAADMLN